jgi:uracil-DNA glycosylase
MSRAHVTSMLQCPAFHHPLRRSLALSFASSFRIRRLASMAGDNDDEVSYYEDTQEKKTVASDDGAGAKTPSASQDKDKGKGKAPTPAKAPAVGEKRQRTLEGMFGGAATKKPKLERPAAAAGSKRAPGTTLNSIPFSMSEFEASLSDEEKELLQLECATIGKSWCVPSSRSCVA